MSGKRWKIFFTQIIVLKNLDRPQRKKIKILNDSNFRTNAIAFFLKKIQAVTLNKDKDFLFKTLGKLTFGHIYNTR